MDKSERNVSMDSEGMFRKRLEHLGDAMLATQSQGDVGGGRPQWEALIRVTTCQLWNKESR